MIEKSSNTGLDDFSKGQLFIGEYTHLSEKKFDLFDHILVPKHILLTEEEAQDLGARLLKGDFTLIDLYEQMLAMKKMGSLSKIVEMVPGFSQLKMPKEMLDVQEGKLEKWKHCMDSMTQEELEDPEVISSTRIDRIAKGSGCSSSDVRDLIKQYRQGKKMMKMMKGGKNMDKMMKKMGGMGNMANMMSKGVKFK